MVDEFAGPGIVHRDGFAIDSLQAEAYASGRNDFGEALPPWSRFKASPLNLRHQVREMAVGWPWRCVCGYSETELVDLGAFGWYGHGAIIGLHPYPSSTDDAVWMLPTTPLWAGLVLDTATWGAAWLLIGLIPAARGATNRWYWRWRKLCPFCQYDMRASPSDVCPECGHSNRRAMPLIGAGAIALLATCLLMQMALIVSTIIYAVRSWDRIALQIAAYEGDVDLLRTALTKGIDVNQKFGGYGYWFEETTLLTIAAMGGHEQMVSFLLHAGAEVNPQSTMGTPLMAAAAHDRVKAMELLVKAGADLNATSRWASTALWCAAYYRARDSVQWLLRAAADVNAPLGRSPLSEAAGQADLEMMRWLLEAGAQVNPERSRGLTPLRAAASSGRLEAVELMLAHGAQMQGVERRGLYPMEYAIWSHNAPIIVQRLITAGADVNAQDDDGDTPLMLAAAQNDLATVSILLEADADPSFINSNGYSAEQMGGLEVTAAIRRFAAAHPKRQPQK